jgi:hypothetical protein
MMDDARVVKSCGTLESNVVIITATVSMTIHAFSLQSLGTRLSAIRWGLEGARRTGARVSDGLISH